MLHAIIKNVQHNPKCLPTAASRGEGRLVNRVRNCAFLVANATKNFALATRISQLVASGRLTISCHDNYTNNNFDFQPNRLK